MLREISALFAVSSKVQKHARLITSQAADTERVSDFRQ